MTDSSSIVTRQGSIVVPIMSRNDGITEIGGRPHARLIINGAVLLTSDPDELGQLASDAKQACGELVAARASRANRAAQRINRENHGTSTSPVRDSQAS